MSDRPGLPPDELGDDVRDEARRAIEAIVLVGEQPIDTRLLSQLLELAPAVVEDLCHELAAEYEAEGRGFQLARVAGGWRYQTHPDQAPYVERFVLEGQTAKLSAAALETLAIVAYKQPISRAQVGAIRGVSVDGVMRTLAQRGYIAEVGRDPGPGQAVMFGTTPAFLEKLGVDNLDDLPALGDFVPGADVVEQLERGLRPENRSPSELLAPTSEEGDGWLGDEDGDEGDETDTAGVWLARDEGGDSSEDEKVVGGGPARGWLGGSEDESGAGGESDRGGVGGESGGRVGRGPARDWPGGSENEGEAGAVGGSGWVGGDGDSGPGGESGTGGESDSGAGDRDGGAGGGLDVGE